MFIANLVKLGLKLSGIQLQADGRMDGRTDKRTEGRETRDGHGHLPIVVPSLDWECKKKNLSRNK